MVKTGPAAPGMFSGLSVKKAPAGAEAALSPPSVAPYPGLPKQDLYTPPQIPAPPRPAVDGESSPTPQPESDNSDEKPAKLLPLPSKVPRPKPDQPSSDPSWGRKGFVDSEPESFAELRKRKQEELKKNRAEEGGQEGKTEGGKTETGKSDQAKTEVPKATGLRAAEEVSKPAEKVEREKRAAEEKEKLRYQNPETLQLWIKERLAQYAKQLDEKNKKQVELLTETERLRSKLDSLQSNKLQTLDQQDQAAAEEDYDEAERLNTVVRELDVSIIQTDHEIARATSAYQAYEDDKTEVYRTQKAFLAEVQGKCVERRAAEEAELGTFTAAKTMEEDRKRKEIEAETERVASETTRLSTESELLESERVQTQATIEEHTHELLHARTAAQSELTSLEEQIESLEAKLLELKTRRDLFRAQVQENEREIEERTSVFQDELFAVETKAKKIDREKGRLTADVEALEAAKAALAAFQAETKAAIELRDARLAGLSLCATEVKSRQERIEQLEASRKQFIETIEQNTRLMKEKEEQLKAAADYEKTVKETAEEVRVKVQLKRDRMAELEAKIPRLDAEKKTLAAAKQYKDAARLANEVKAAITERESLSEEIERMRQTQSEQESHLCEVVSTQLQQSSLELRSEVEKLGEEAAAARKELMGHMDDDQASLE